MFEIKIPEKKPDGLDFLSLGALVTRLDPGIVPFSFAKNYELHVSGGEYNVAANLSSCFGLKTGIATAIVDSPIGLKVEASVREMGVEGIYSRFKTDGVRGPNIATVWSDRGYGLRPPVVFYNRANEAAALLKPGSFDWNRIFSKGVRWFHSGGIFASLSSTTPLLILEAMKEAKQANAVVSFDLNYREKLWAVSGGKEYAQSILRKIVKEVDILVGNEEDLQKGLGLKGPEVEKKDKLNPEVFFKMMEQVASDFPNIKICATTLREVHSANKHSWAAVLWTRNNKFETPKVEIDVYDRVGGGDGFASGLFYGLLSGRSEEDALKLGWAHGALVATFPGDTTMARLEQVEAFIKGGSARIQR